MKICKSTKGGLHCVRKVDHVTGSHVGDHHAYQGGVRVNWNDNSDPAPVLPPIPPIPHDPPKKQKVRRYHGWILQEDGGPGYKDYFTVEWTNENGHRDTYQGFNESPIGWRGQSGAAQACEWWEKKLGKTIQLQPMLKGSYRVYTIEEE